MHVADRHARVDRPSASLPWLDRALRSARGIVGAHGSDATVAAMAAPLALNREQILAFRRRVGALDERLPPGDDSLRQAAWAGLQDSMPRAALLSVHARLSGTEPPTWEHPSLVQLWGPRYQVNVVASAVVAAFRQLEDELTPVRTPNGDAWLLTADEQAARAAAAAPAPARLLPSGDAYYLLWGADRALLVPDAARRDQLWTSRVWPGALLV